MTTDDFFSAKAGAAIAAKTIVKFTAVRNEVAPATAGTDALAGVADMGAASGDMVDIAYGDIFEVVAGGPIAAGDPLTADAQGRAVKAVKSAGVTVHVIGYARVPAVAGDIFDFIVARGVIVG